MYYSKREIMWVLKAEKIEQSHYLDLWARHIKNWDSSDIFQCANIPETHLMSYSHAYNKKCELVTQLWQWHLTDLISLSSSLLLPAFSPGHGIHSSCVKGDQPLKQTGANQLTNQLYFSQRKSKCYFWRSHQQHTEFSKK